MSTLKEGLDTLCVHASEMDDEYGSVVTPIYQVSTFQFRSADHGASLFKGEENGYIYTRLGNPTIESMEKAVATLEGGYKALGCASGMAASSLLFFAYLQAGDHVVCSESTYGPTNTLLRTHFKKFGISTTFVDTSDLEAVEKAFNENTKMVFVESPGNPTLVVSDIAEIAAVSHKKGAILAVDNTFNSPIITRPFEFGADVVMHSMTKFLNGHADVVAGVVVAKNKDDYGLLKKSLNHLGGTITPFNSFLVSRGIRTLKLRIEKSCENAKIVCDFLSNHPKVEWCIYPGLESHPQHEIAKKQMSSFGTMIVVELKGGLKSGKILMDNIKVWTLAVSLGGVESLIQHPASMTHASMSKEMRFQAKITDGLVRLSVGIEDPNDLIEGLKCGLDKIIL